MHSEFKQWLEEQTYKRRLISTEYGGHNSWECIEEKYRFEHHWKWHEILFVTR